MKPYVGATKKPRVCPLCSLPLVTIMQQVDVTYSHGTRRYWRTKVGCVHCGVVVVLHGWPGNWRWPKPKDKQRADARRVLGLTR